jgi:hypothetical protein
MPPSTTFSPAPANSFPPATYASQPTNAYPTAPYTQPAYPQQPSAPYGRGGPQQPYNSYQQPAGYAAQPFNGHNQFQQNAPHLQPPRHPTSPLPLPHQIPGLPPKPSVPGLPPRPSFASPPGGFGRGGMSGPPPGQWSPPVQSPMFNSMSPPVPGPVFNGSAAYGAPNQPSQSPHFPTGYGPPQGYGGSQTSPVPVNATSPGSQQVSTKPESMSRIEEPTVTQPPPEAPIEKEEQPPLSKPKRETKLVYGDNDISPVSVHVRLGDYLLISLSNLGGKEINTLCISRSSVECDYSSVTAPHTLLYTMRKPDGEKHPKASIFFMRWWSVVSFCLLIH